VINFITQTEYPLVTATKANDVVDLSSIDAPMPHSGLKHWAHVIHTHESLAMHTRLQRSARRSRSTFGAPITVPPLQSVTDDSDRIAMAFEADTRQACHEIVVVTRGWSRRATATIYFGRTAFDAI